MIEPEVLFDKLKLPVLAKTPYSDCPAPAATSFFTVSVSSVPPYAETVAPAFGAANFGARSRPQRPMRR